MSNAILGTGVLLKRGDAASPEVFTTLAEIQSLKPPQLSRNEIDVSTHNAGVEEKILGMLRTGQISGVLNWIPSNATHSDSGVGIHADILANIEANWQIAFPDSPSTVFTMACRVQLFDPQDITTDSPMLVNFALTVNGAITVT